MFKYLLLFCVHSPFDFFKASFNLICMCSNLLVFPVMAFGLLEIDRFWASPFIKDWTSQPGLSLEAAWWALMTFLRLLYLCCYLAISFWGICFLEICYYIQAKPFWPGNHLSLIKMRLHSFALIHCVLILFLSSSFKKQLPWGLLLYVLSLGSSLASEFLSFLEAV